ncbi:outer membrane beta-barrel protein [Consotaella aegiceratis]|uniref:outer membrane beta-barrel protein n=1 Tax=Consotaella aegiceratis TaxID=3097961 RepID=UPI002F3FC3D4
MRHRANAAVGRTAAIALGAAWLAPCGPALAQSLDTSDLRISEPLAASGADLLRMLSAGSDADDLTDPALSDLLSSDDPQTSDASDFLSDLDGDEAAEPPSPQVQSFDLFTDAEGRSATLLPATPSSDGSSSGVSTTDSADDGTDPDSGDVAAAANLDATTTGTVGLRTGTSELDIRQNERTERLDIDPEHRANAERLKEWTDPFAPVGLRAGSFVLYPTLEQGVGVSSNLSNSADGESGAFSETSLGVQLLSDWLLHEMEINASTSYRRNFAGDTEDDPTFDADGRLRLDIDHETTATLRGSIAYSQDDPEASDAASDDRADVLDMAASATLERLFGLASLSATGGVQRHAETEDESFSQDYNTYTASLRAGYQISPALQPFVEGSLGLRRFDEPVAQCCKRDSQIDSLKGGVAFDLGEKLTGEVAAGYAWNIPDADSIPVDSAPTVDATLDWSPRRGTDITLTAATTFEPNDDNLSSSSLYQAILSARHRATERVELNAQLSAGRREGDRPEDQETTYSAQAGFLYWVNRTLALTGLVRHEGEDSEAPDDDYTATSARLGIKLQR